MKIAPTQALLLEKSLLYPKRSHVSLYRYHALFVRGASTGQKGHCLPPRKRGSVKTGLEGMRAPQINTLIKLKN